VPNILQPNGMNPKQPFTTNIPYPLPHFPTQLATDFLTPRFLLSFFFFLPFLSSPLPTSPISIEPTLQRGPVVLVSAHMVLVTMRWDPV
jgi:hypothetical protein